MKELSYIRLDNSSDLMISFVSLNRQLRIPWTRMYEIHTFHLRCKDLEESLTIVVRYTTSLAVINLKRVETIHTWIFFQVSLQPLSGRGPFEFWILWTALLALAYIFLRTCVCMISFSLCVRWSCVFASANHRNQRNLQA